MYAWGRKGGNVIRSHMHEMKPGDHSNMQNNSPGHGAQLTQATAEVVKNMECPTVHTHSVAHVVDKIIQQFSLSLRLRLQRTLLLDYTKVTIIIAFCGRMVGMKCILNLQAEQSLVAVVVHTCMRECISLVGPFL